MSKFLKDIFTERNNETYDIVRIMGTLSLCVYICLAVTELLRHCHDFNLLEAAGGFAVLMGVLGAGVTYKYTKE